MVIRRFLPLFCVCLAVSSGTQAHDKLPTYTGDIAALMNHRCVACHWSGAAAGALPLTNYDEVRSVGKRALAAVESGAMPPWPIDPANSVPMSNDPRLSTDERQTLRRWVEGGMPAGTGVAPTIATNTWRYPTQRPPDAIVSMPSIKVPATGELPYLRMLIKVPFKQDHWVGALQAVPGDARVVHHMGIAEVALPPGMDEKQVADLQRLVAQMGISGASLSVDKPAVVDSALSGGFDMLSAFTLGDGIAVFPPGTGKLIRGGDGLYISFNIHYTTIGMETTDQSRLGLWFLDSPPARQLFRTPSPGNTILADGHELFPDDPGSRAEGTNVAIPPIAPNVANYELVGINGYDRAVTLYSFQPHAHLRARDFRYEVVYPDGHSQTLLSIPKYNYHWQLEYLLATPVDLPAGSKLIVTAHYDNSVANQHLAEFKRTNPGARCGPDQYTYFRSQNQTWDEMFSPLVQYAVAGGDSNASTPTTPQVATTGCLVGNTSQGWRIERATHATESRVADISHAELDAAKGASGNESYVLIGAGPFRPGALVSQQVLVKGLLIGSAGGSTINATALMDTGVACPP